MNLQSTVRSVVLSFILLVALAAGSHAQPDLNFKRIRLEWPYVELYFSVGCNGIKHYQLKPSDVRVYEDGREITDFGLWCPDPTSRCPITVGLVFDASDSMTGEGSVGAKHGGATFIGNMDNTIDEACVIHFNQSVWVYQHMTTDTLALKTAVSLLPTFGATALWDAIFTALAIVQNNGSNQCRAVIVLSDGEDNSSTRHGLPDVIAFAVRYNIRVFPIGYGEDIAEDELRMLAEMTGGVYYQTPNAAELAGIYREISTILYDYFQECLFTYDPRCGDDQLHEVELRVEDLCGGDATLRRSYQAPRDSSTFQEKHFAFAEATGMGGGEIRVPIELRSPYFRELLYPLSITTLFDRRKLELLRVETPPGTLLAGMPLHIANLSNGGTVRIPDSRVIDGSGILAYAVFRSAVHSLPADYSIRVHSAVFDKGCHIPLVEDGSIHVTPSRAVLQCDMQMPASVSWDATRLRYEPYPFVVRVDFSNTGTLPAVGGTVTLGYDARIFELLEASSVQVIDTLHAGGQASMQWRLAVRPQASPLSAELCVVTSFEGVEEPLCCATVDIPEAGMLLGCGIELPTIQYSAAAKAFLPNPFDLALHVDNSGVVGSGTLRAVLQLPEGLYIESGEQYDKPLNPTTLPPGASASLGWRLRLVSPLGGESLPIRIELRNDGNVYRGCLDTLYVPAIPPTFEPGITAGGPTTFCEGDSVVLDAGEGFSHYRWNTGARTRFLTVRANGNYVATVRDAQGNVGESKGMTVTVFPRPDKPMISRDRNTLVIDGYEEMQWYRNGSPLGGATAARLELQQTGVYVVRVRNAAGCENESDPFIVNVLSASAPLVPERAELTLYPHPVTRMLHARLLGVPEGGDVTFRVVDVLGRTVLENFDVTGSHSTHVLDVGSLRPGMYFLTATAGSRRLTTKFLRE
jgi:hypothetical protein